MPLSEVNTAEVMASYLAEAGISTVFAYPGDPIIELMERARQYDISVILARREGTAAFMAEAYGVVAERPGVCISTLGPGSTAMVNGVAAANLDRVPLLAISGQIDAAREPYFTHQVVDHQALYAPVTKWAGRVERGSVGTVMRKALRMATAERPGAVHLSCGSDTFKAIASDADVSLPPLDGPRGGFGVAGVADPERIVQQSRRPVLLAGIGAVRCRAGKALQLFAEDAGIPIVVSPMAKGVVPEDSPMFAGTLDMACNEVVWDLLHSADLIVTAGFDPVDLIKSWKVAARVLHIDTTPNVDQVYASSCEIIGDVAAALDWLASSWTGEPRWSEAELDQHRARLRDAYYAGRVNDHLNPSDVIDVVAGRLAPNAVVTTDVGSHKLLVGQGWPTREPRSVLMTNGLSAMGFGVPAAITAKLIHRDRPVAALVGDGGFAMVATEMRLAASLALPIVVVVFVDGSLNRIELKQLASDYPSTATRLEDVDLVGLAAAMDCDGVRVESATELDRALADVAGLSRPLVVEARIDPQQYESQF